MSTPLATAWRSASSDIQGTRYLRFRGAPQAMNIALIFDRANCSGSLIIVSSSWSIRAAYLGRSQGGGPGEAASQVGFASGVALSKRSSCENRAWPPLKGVRYCNCSVLAVYSAAFDCVINASFS